jgi:hypothetical protein
MTMLLNPEKPFTIIMGGAKMDDKLDPDGTSYYLSVIICCVTGWACQYLS